MLSKITIINMTNIYDKLVLFLSICLANNASETNLDHTPQLLQICYQPPNPLQ